MRTPGPPSAEVDPLHATWSAALRDDAAAVRALVAALRPVVHARIARALRNNPQAWKRDPREELADLIQEIFLQLFKDDGALLRRWRPDGGMSIRNYVGLIAYRRATSVLARRVGRWQAEPDDGARLDAAAGSVRIDRAVERRDLLRALVATLRAELSAQQFALFTALVLEERDIAELSAAFAMSPNALYTARSRFLSRARKILAQIDEDPTQTAGGS